MFPKPPFCDVLDKNWVRKIAPGGALSCVKITLPGVNTIFLEKAGSGRDVALAPYANNPRNETVGTAAAPAQVPRPPWDG